ncbi:MAG: ATP-dependent zinc metalloprotease FtsH [Deltaproteobacteria bacterium]|nr:ATP-dependent zinc metalloprotease FtsH [Deltaproteobacteria bacterium]
MRQQYKTILVWVVLIGLFVMLFKLYNKSGEKVQEVKFSTFIKDVENGVKFKDITITGNKITGKYLAENRKFKSTGLISPQLLEKLDQEQVEYEIEKEEESYWPTLLISWLPMLLLFLLFFFFLRQLQGGAGKAMSFGKARVRMLGENEKKVTFADVAGVEEAKEEVEELVDFLKDPGKFTKLGGEIPKGVLLIGMPGTGKTLLAKAIAGEAGVPFFSISGSDFVEMFVGVGASRVRDLFEQGKKNAPCIIFMDEIDAVGRQRGAGLGGGHDEREQTLNQLLVEMDGFEGKEGIILIAATNRPDVLDPALLRPGRFDRRVVVNMPDVRGRQEILAVHIANREVPVASDLDLEILAKGTPGFSGADLANLVNEAAIMAARQDKDKVHHGDFEFAKDKIMMGSERRSMVVSDKEKRTTAYHEAGHAAVAMLVEGEKDPVHKATIVPRGKALGLVMRLPDEDRLSMSRDYLYNLLAISLGGRVSEEVFLNQMTNGASSDLEYCTKLARKMVCEWGMSDKLGPLTYGTKEEEIFLGREVTVHKDISDQTSRAIDEEVFALVSRAYKVARSIIENNRNIVETITKSLLEKETLDHKDLIAIIGKKEDSSFGENMFPESSPEPSPSF